MNVTLTTELKQLARLKPKTVGGADAVVDGPSTWTVISGNGRVEPQPDGLSAFLVSSDAVDGITTVIKADVDADRGAGIRTLSIIFEITTTAAEADSIGAELDAPVPKV